MKKPVKKKSSGYGMRPKSANPKSGARETGAASGKSGASKGGAGAAAAKIAPVADKADRTKFDYKNKFELPAISVMMKKKTNIDAGWNEKRKKKMIRRNVPPGEDTKKLLEIVKSLRNQEINVHEFVGLVSPSTGDQAQSMKTILAEEMTSFRKMCRRVYDTMTQDVSDVLANEQVQLADNFKFRNTMYNDKLMRSIDEIYAYVPDFDFELYYQDDEYLKKKFPLCVADSVNADEEETLLRQEAFHRYQWLRSEGERLSAENNRLQVRLTYLKKQQKVEMQRTHKIQVQSEEIREKLEVTEEALQVKVEELNKSIEKTMVHNEVLVMQQIKAGALKKQSNLKVLKQEMKRKKKETGAEWNVVTAKEVEEKTTEEVAQSQISQVSVTSTAAISSSTGAIKKQLKRPKGEKKKKFKRPPPLPQDPDAFHYSPPKTPPGSEMPQQERSPFHFSPNRSPTGAQGGSPGGLPGQPPRPQRTVRMETTTTVMEPTYMPKGPRYSHHHSANLW